MASRWARRRSGSPSASTAGPRMRSSSCPTACCGISPTASAARRRAARGVARAVRCVQAEASRARRCAGAHAEARAAGGLGQGDSRNSPPTRRAWPTRDASGKTLNAIAPAMPWLLGGAADLAASTKTRLDVRGGRRLRGRALWRPQFPFRHSRARAWARSATASRSRSCAPTARTYLIFTDYMKPAIRLSALMEIPVIYIFTHDSIGLGEDGPTHQPVEQLHHAARHSRPRHDPADGRQRDGGGVARHHEAEAPAGLPRAEPPGAARRSIAATTPRPPASRAAPMSWPIRPPASRRCSSSAPAARCRSVSTPTRRSTQEGIRGPCRQHAVLGTLRGAGPGVPGQRPAARDHRPRLGRAGLDAGLGALCRPHRRHDRHAHVRRFGAVQGTSEEIRLHAGESVEAAKAQLALSRERRGGQRT